MKKHNSKNHSLLLVEKAWEVKGIKYVEVDGVVYIELDWVLKSLEGVRKIVVRK